MSRQDRKKRRMIILSLDAVGGRDLAYMETLPNLAHSLSGRPDAVKW